MIRLIAWYAVHTFVNSIKKLFRTWLAILIGIVAITGLLGGVVGGSIAWLVNSQEEETSAYEEEYTPPQEEDTGEEQPDTEAALTRFEPLIGGIIFLVVLGVILIYVYLGDKSGTTIFEMADVNLLFTAPLKPQSVLAFRLVLNATATLVASIYLLGQIPTLLNAGFSGPGIFSVFLGYVLMLVIAQLAGVLTYTLVANKRSGKGSRLPFGLNRLIAVGIALLSALWLFSLIFLNKLPVTDALAASFGAPAMRLIPIIGWLTAFILAASARAYVRALLFLVLTLAGIAILALVIWRLPADFYEDALPGAEKKAALIEAQRSGTTLQSDRKRRLPARLAGREKRFAHGRGATVFFFRSLHHRFRAGLMGLFTSDALACYALFIGYTIIAMYFIKTRIVYPVFLIFLFISLFKAYVNILAEELNGHLLLLTPDVLWKKLLAAILSNTVSHALDLVPGFIVMLLVMRPALGECLVFLIMLICAQLYGDCLSFFVRMVLPPRLADTIYALFYYGLLTIGIIIPFLAVVASIALHHMLAGVIISSIVMLLFAAAAFAAGCALLDRGMQ